jgi:WD40 repeat protein
MSTNTNLTTSAFGVFRLPAVAHHETVLFLPPQAMIALAKTCKYFQQLVEQEALQKRYLQIQCPQFKPLYYEIKNTPLSAQFCLDMLTVTHSPDPGVFCSSTIYTGVFPRSLQLTPDQTKVLVGMEDYTSHALSLYDLNNAECIWTLLEKHSPSSLQITPDGKYALVSSEENVEVIDLKNGEIHDTLISLLPDSIRYLHIGPDGTLYAGSSGNIQSWDLKTRRCNGFFNSPSIQVTNHDAQFSQNQQISPDGTTAISALENGNLLFWQLETEKILQTLEGHAPSDQTVINIPTAISADNTIAVSASMGELRIWDLTTGKCKKVIELQSEVTAMHVSPDMKSAILGYSNGFTELFNLESGKGNKMLVHFKTKVTSLQLTPDKRAFISGGEDGCINFWTLCQLPEQRLRNIASACLKYDNHESQSLRVLLSSLPSFTKNEIESIYRQIKNATQSVDIYTATNILQLIRRPLRRAQSEPKSAQIRVSEALIRIAGLSDGIKQAICKHANTILASKGLASEGTSFEQVLSDPKRFTSFFTEATFVEAGIKAIDLTIEEFETKLEAVICKPESKKDD